MCNIDTDAEENPQYPTNHYLNTEIQRCPHYHRKLVPALHHRYQNLQVPKVLIKILWTGQMAQPVWHLPSKGEEFKSSEPK